MCSTMGVSALPKPKSHLSVNCCWGICLLLFAMRVDGLLFKGLSSHSQIQGLALSIWQAHLDEAALGASVSCLRSYCQPFRTDPGMLCAPLALYFFPSFFLLLSFSHHLSFWPSPVVLSELWTLPLLSLLSFFLCPSLLYLHLLFPFLCLSPKLTCPLLSSSSHPISLVFLSYKGLTADSDSKSTQWTNDTNTWGHHFIYSAQKAKLSVRPWPGASLHHCPSSADARAMGPWHLEASAWTYLSPGLPPSPTQAEDASF